MGAGWLTPRPGRFTPRKETPYLLYTRLGGPVWTGAGNLAPTEIRSPDRRACSESLYRLSYPGPHAVCSRSAGSKSDLYCLRQAGRHWNVSRTLATRQNGADGAVSNQVLQTRKTLRPVIGVGRLDTVVEQNKDSNLLG